MFGYLASSEAGCAHVLSRKHLWAAYVKADCSIPSHVTKTSKIFLLNPAAASGLILFLLKFLLFLSCDVSDQRGAQRGVQCSKW